ncbi:MAG TPA: tetratricopeptide repeat protein, partial [Candidatus Polarisedimenticolia bacterium]
AAPTSTVPAGGKEMLEQAKKLTDAGRHQEAVELYRAYIAKDPNGNPAVYYYLGKSLFESDDLRGADQAFRKGLELSQNMKGAHFYLGNIALKDERPAEAIPEFEKELALSPDSDSVYYNLGKAYEQSGNDAKALETLEKAATLNTTKPEPLMQMAAIYEKQRDAAQTPPDKSAAAAKAGAVYDRIKAIDPKNAAILFFNVGAKAKNENRMKEAVQAFQKSVEIDPTYASGHRELGYALIGTQDFAGAIKQFQEYLKLTPAAPDAKDIQKTIAAIK